MHERRRQQRWRLVSQSARTENDFDAEQVVRLTVLEVLYARRRTEPYDPSLPQTDLEEMSGRPREHLEFTIWFLLQKKLISRGDNMNVTITADGVGHREELPCHARDTPVAGRAAPGALYAPCAHSQIGRRRGHAPSPLLGRCHTSPHRLQP